MQEVFYELFSTLWELIKLFFSLLIIILSPILYLLKYLLLNIANFISLVITSFITLIILFGQMIKTLSEYLQFFPLMIRNILNYIYIILDYIIYILAIIIAFLTWFFGFAENGCEDEFF